MTEERKGQSGWLIERYHNNQTQYWNCGNGGGVGPIGDYAKQFTPNVDDAVRFVRSLDAEIVLYRILNGAGRVAEHVWAA